MFAGKSFPDSSRFYGSYAGGTDRVARKQRSRGFFVTNNHVISAQIKEIGMDLTAYVAFTSLIVSVISSIYGFTQNRKLQEFEHRTQEDTKEDLVNLDAVLKSIIVKSSYRSEMKNLKFDAEKKDYQ